MAYMVGENGKVKNTVKGASGSSRKKKKDWRSSYNDPNSTGESGSTAKGGDWRAQYAAEREQTAPLEKTGQLTSKEKEPEKAKFRGFNNVEVDVNKDELYKTWDSFNEESRKKLAKKIQDNAKNGDNDAVWLNKWLEQGGKYKKGFWGEANDFIEGANDKLYGGMVRGATNLVELAPGDQGTEKWKKDYGYDDESNFKYTKGGKAGQKFGSAEKGIVDTAMLVTGAGAADKAVKGAGVISKLEEGGRAAQLAAKLAPRVAGSLAGTGISAGQDVAAGNKNQVVKNAAIGTAADLLLPGVGKALKYGDSAAGKVIAKVAGEEGSAGLKQIGEKGVVGGLNSMFRDAARKGVYKGSDLLSKTKTGSKIIDMKDDFMTKWVTDMHPLYKTLKRSDFEGKTEGAYLAAREAIGNSNRALSYAQDFIENDPGMKTVVEGIQAKNPDVVAGRKAFDEYAKVRSEIDLASAGKKEFSEKKLGELNERLAKIGTDSHAEEYDGLVKFYKDINDFRLENGLISKEQYDQFADEGFDYVRQQRELPQWMLDKPAGKGAGSKASIAGSEAIQKRNKYASAELLSPLETAIKTAQMAHVEAYRNKAAKTVTDLLTEAGEAKLVRTTDMVRDKQALLKNLKESKPVVQKLNKTLRSNVKQVKRLETAMSNLSKEGLDIQLKRGAKEEMPEAFRYLNVDEIRNPITVKGKKTQPLLRNDALTGTATTRLTTGKGADMRKVMRSLVTEDPARLKQIRKMIESRDAKLGPLLDTVELMNRDLHELYAQRSGVWNQANAIKTTVDKGGMTSLSFLDDGVENVVKVDPVIASAVHNWDKQQQNVMNNFLRMSNNVFKYGTTGLNAGFALPNFVADQVGSAINSKSIMATHNPSNFIHSLFMTMGRPLNAADQDLLQKYMAGNAGALNINQYTKAATSDKVANKLVREGAGKGSQAYTLIKNPKEGFRALFRSMEDLIGVTENLTRVQNFRGTALKAAKEGMGENAIRLANTAARENSVDFLEMGTYGRVVNSFVPYFNAAIQGNRVMLRNAGERPVSFAAKTAALIGMPIAASTAWNVSDPDRKAIYDTIPEYVKETNFVIVGPGAKWNDKKNKWDGVFLMKKPPGFKEFAEPVRKFMEYKADKPDADLMGFLRDEGGSVASDFSSTITPIDFSDPNKFLSSVTPQILKPTAEAITNKNFFTGEDIVPDYLKDQAPQDQKYEKYSQLTSHIAGMFNTSPLKVDQWIRQTFGEVGTNAVNSVDRLSGAPKEAQGGRSLQESISRRFVGAPGGADTDAFYKTYSPAQSARSRASKQVTELVKQGKIQEAKRRAQEYNSTVNDRFDGFFKQYGDSPNYDPKWNERIQDLLIPINDRAFSARRRQK